MAPARRFNPFYLLLVVAGILFAITACAYGVMMFAALRTTGGELQHSTMIEFMEAHGGALLSGELALLAVATVGAIASDGFWQRRGRPSAPHEARSSFGEADPP